MATQRCPNCQTVHDTSIYVSGQRVQCTRCGIRFEVSRADVPPGQATSYQRPVTAEEHPVPMPAPMSAAGGPGVNDQQTFIARRAQIPGYELLELIGKGGMGEVWRGKQLSLSRTVAVKILSHKLAQEPEFIARFEKESAAMAALGHPNIVSIIDRGHVEESAGETARDRTYYFVMELVDGVSLRELMQQKQIGPDDAVRIVAQVCRAMDYAHERGVIHRDLKPENILVTRAGEVKVADFGLAGIAGDGVGGVQFAITRTSVAMGTLNYMAPEQRKDAKSVDHRADLYSLGVVLYELLTKEVPIGRFLLPSEKVKGLDVRLDSVVARALQSEPDARYQRASHIGAALEGLISTRPNVDPSLVAGAEPSGPIEQPPDQRSSAHLAKELWRSLPPPARWAFLIVVALLAASFFLRGSPKPIVDKMEKLVGLHLDEEESAAGSESHLQVAAKTELHGDRQSVGLEFAPPPKGEGAEIHAHNGGKWTLDRGALAMDGFATALTPKDPTPRAYLESPRFAADGFHAEVAVTLDARAPKGARISDGVDPFAELFLRQRETDMALRITLGETPTVTLSWKFEDASGKPIQGDVDLDGAPEPESGKTYKLGLAIRGTELVATVDGQVVGTEAFPASVEHAWGKVGVGCAAARCRFGSLAVEGRVVGPGAPAAHDEPTPKHSPPGPSP